MLELTGVAAIVPAGGCGNLGNGTPKILERLPNGKTIIGEVLATLREVGFEEIVVVANNNLFQGKIQEALGSEGYCGDIVFALQYWRLGAAEAVAVGLEKLETDIHTVVVTYADMPLWSPLTFCKLLFVHRSLLCPVTLGTVTITKSTPEEVLRYGRILRNAKGQMMEIIEPGDAISSDLDKVATVNPSLYAFNVPWLRQNLGHILPAPKRDGYPQEFRLPHIVKVAREHGAQPIGEFEITDPEEALGVNTPSELEDVRAVFARREKGKIHELDFS